MRAEAIIFDVDGTLYNRKEILSSAFFLLLKHWKYFPSYRKVRHFLHKKVEIVPMGEQSEGVNRKFLEFQAEQQVKFCRKNVDNQQLVEWRAAFIADFDQLFNKVVPPNNLINCLEQCRTLGLKMGILTDLPLSKKLERLGLESYWQVKVCSENFGVLKPHNAVFLHTARLLGVDPKSVIFVGDHYVYDILGANAVGMRTAHYTKKKIVNTQANLTFFDYQTLAENIKIWVK